MSSDLTSSRRPSQRVSQGPQSAHEPRQHDQQPAASSCTPQTQMHHTQTDCSPFTNSCTHAIKHPSLTPTHSRIPARLELGQMSKTSYNFYLYSNSLRSAIPTGESGPTLTSLCTTNSAAGCSVLTPLPPKQRYTTHKPICLHPPTLRALTQALWTPTRPPPDQSSAR